MILCDRSADTLLVLGATSSYVLLMTFNPATQDTLSRGILPDPCYEGMWSAIFIQEHLSHNYVNLQPLK